MTEWTSDQWKSLLELVLAILSLPVSTLALLVLRDIMRKRRSPSQEPPQDVHEELTELRRELAEVRRAGWRKVKGGGED